MEGFGEFGVVDREVEAAKDCADGWVGFPATKVEWFKGIVYGVLPGGDVAMSV